MAKQYISSKGVSYQDFDVSGDAEAREEMVKISGQMGVPVIIIDGEIIIGFDRSRIDELLNIQEEE
jgi:glutaredoxin